MSSEKFMPKYTLFVFPFDKFTTDIMGFAILFTMLQNIVPINLINTSV